jgi:hypothetical protein
VTKSLQAPGRLDADPARRLEHGVERVDARERPGHGRVLGLVGGDHHGHRLVRGAGALQHGLDRDRFVAQRRGDIGDDAGPVDHHEPDVLAADVALDRQRRRGGQVLGRDREGRQRSAAGDVDQVGDHGRCGRPGAGALALGHDGADVIALGDDPVEHALDGGDRRILGDHAGMDPLLDAARLTRGDAEQLDAVAELLGVGDIERRDLADALDVDALQVDLAAEGERGQDGQLVRGVDAVDIEAGIGLGVAQVLRLGQDLVELAAGLAHGAEDVVAGAVEHAVDAPDAVGRQALAQALDDRDAAGYGRLVGERRPGRLGGAREAGAVVREQRLVGGDHVVARRDRALDDRLGHALGAADQLQHHVYLGIGRHGHRVVEPARPREIDRPGLAALAGRDRRDHDLPAAARRDQRAVLLDQPHGLGADGAQARDRDLERFAHEASLRPSSTSFNPSRARDRRLEGDPTVSRAARA